METIEQHVERMLGTPWVQGSDDIENGGLDCFGGCTYAYKCTTGEHLPTPPWRRECQTDKALKSSLSNGDYFEVYSPKNLDLFVCFDYEGVATHCGLWVNNYAYHITGSVDKAGAACLWEIPLIQRVYGSVKYYRVSEK